jgi:hypothetical protein
MGLAKKLKRLAKSNRSFTMTECSAQDVKQACETNFEASVKKLRELLKAKKKQLVEKHKRLSTSPREVEASDRVRVQFLTSMKQRELNLSSPRRFGLKKKPRLSQFSKNCCPRKGDQAAVAV